jgi:hypothetical protein
MKRCPSCARLLADKVSWCPCGHEYSSITPAQSGTFVVAGIGLGAVSVWPLIWEAGVVAGWLFLGLCCAVAVSAGVAAGRESQRTALTVAAAGGTVALPIISFWAIESWPSGHDGSGMIWLFFVLGPSVVTGIGGLLFLVYVGLKSWRR